ncbi:MAG: hypothetical protein HXY23_09365 [Parvularculaceae bacterium]|nr:hypothetical protein [Parvularculaceae bacterium]
MWEWLQQVWKAAVDLCRRIGRLVREDVPWRALAALAGVLIGALVSAAAIWSLEEYEASQICSVESVKEVRDSHPELQWSREICEDLRKGEAVDGISDEQEKSLRDMLDQAAKVHGRDARVLKAIAGAGAMLWLYAFNADIFRRGRRRARGHGSGGNNPNGAAQPASENESATKEEGSAPPSDASAGSAKPWDFHHVLSPKLWALVCYGFASSACVYFTAHIAGSAAASIIKNTTIHGYTFNPVRHEVIRELHFAQFPADDVDPRGYDRLAWHFFFEKGAFPGESLCTEATKDVECPIPSKEAGFDPKSFAFVGLDTADIRSRLTSIIESLAGCAGDKPVTLKLAAQSSSLDWCGCTNSEQLNTKLAELRAAKIRELFDAAMKQAGNIAYQKVTLAPGLMDYPFDFSDARYSATNPEERYSPHYLAQTAALVLEEPSQCARNLKAPDSPLPAE